MELAADLNKEKLMLIAYFDNPGAKIWFAFVETHVSFEVCLTFG